MTSEAEHPDVHLAAAADSRHVRRHVAVKQREADVANLPLASGRQMMFQMVRAWTDFHFFTLPLSPEMRRLASVIALLLALAAPVAAHPVPFSYVDLRLQGSTIDGSIVVHVYDAGHELSIDPADRLLDPGVLSSQAAALERLLAARIQVEANGRVLTPTWLGVEPIADRQSVRLHLRYNPGTPPGVVGVHAALFPVRPDSIRPS